MHVLFFKARRGRSVEIGEEAMDVCHDTVSGLVDAIHADHGHL